MAIPDVVAEVNRIRAAGLITDYAIGGAIAAQAYIETSATVDVDVFVVFGAAAAHSLAPLVNVWADLVAHGAKEEEEYHVIGDWPVQFCRLELRCTMRQSGTHGLGIWKIFESRYLSSNA